MKRTESRLARAAVAASLFAATAAAHAVPIVFDFSGTVGSTVGRNFLDNTGWIDDALSGQSFSGRITIETEGLVQSSSSTPTVTTFGYYDSGLDPTILITSEFSIGGVSYDIGSYTYNTGGFAGQDALTPALSRDSITVTHRSSENINGVAVTDGLYAGLALRLSWNDPNDPLGLVDLSNFDPLSLIPRLNSLTPTSYYDQYTTVCTAGNCVAATTTATVLTIDSFTVSTPSVPEPGTLALLVVGLLGTGMATRRKKQ